MSDMGTNNAFYEVRQRYIDAQLLNFNWNRVSLIHCNGISSSVGIILNY